MPTTWTITTASRPPGFSIATTSDPDPEYAFGSGSGVGVGGIGVGVGGSGVAVGGFGVAVAFGVSVALAGFGVFVALAGFGVFVAAASAAGVPEPEPEPAVPSVVDSQATSDRATNKTRINDTSRFMGSSLFFLQAALEPTVATEREDMTSRHNHTTERLSVSCR